MVRDCGHLAAIAVLLRFGVDGREGPGLLSLLALPVDVEAEERENDAAQHHAEPHDRPHARQGGVDACGEDRIRDVLWNARGIVEVMGLAAMPP